jgi:hypothetical protein
MDNLAESFIFPGNSLKDLCVPRLAWYRQGCGSGYGQEPGIFI